MECRIYSSYALVLTLDPHWRPVTPHQARLLPRFISSQNTPKGEKLYLDSIAFVKVRIFVSLLCCSISCFSFGSCSIRRLLYFLLLCRPSFGFGFLGAGWLQLIYTSLWVVLLISNVKKRFQLSASYLLNFSDCDRSFPVWIQKLEYLFKSGKAVWIIDCDMEV